MDQAICSKKLASIWTAWAIHSKNLASVRTAQAICSKKFVSHSNGLSYPFKSAIRMARAICPKKIVGLWNSSSCPVQKILFEISVGKIKTVTSSLTIGKWSAASEVCVAMFLCHLGSICGGMSQLRSTQLFTCAKTFHRGEYSWLLTTTASYHD